MPVDWTDDSDARERAPRIPAGAEVDVTITRIIFGGKQGPYVSRDGDPQIMLVVATDAGQEAAEMVTLGERAAWKMKSILRAVMPDSARAAMKQDGVEIYHFADEAFAKANLIGKRGRVIVGDYRKVTGFRVNSLDWLRPRQPLPAPPSPKWKKPPTEGYQPPPNPAGPQPIYPPPPPAPRTPAPAPAAPAPSQQAAANDAAPPDPTADEDIPF